MKFPKTVRAGLWALAILGLAEAAIRARSWYRHGSAGPVADIYELDEFGERRLRAGAELRGCSRKVQINRLGFRGTEPQVPKPQGSLRILAVGDSTTFGMEAADDEAVWVSRLGAELRERGIQAETINAAVPGYTLAASIARIDSFATLEPDVVVINHVTTDIAAHARRQFGPGAMSNESSSMGKLFEARSLLLNLVKANSAALTARWLPSRRHNALDDRGVQEYADRLVQFVERCRRQGWRVVLWTAPRSFCEKFPLAEQFRLAATSLANNPALSLAGLNDAFDRYNDAIRKVAGATGATLVDLDRAVPRGADYFVDAVHLNDAGHALVGDTIARELLPLIDAPALARSMP